MGGYMKGGFQMNNKHAKWPGEPPSPYGEKGKKDFENYQRKVDVFLEDMEHIKEQTKQESNKK